MNAIVISDFNKNMLTIEKLRRKGGNTDVENKGLRLEMLLRGVHIP